ncbi:L-serine ammonia-lyase, iron-sulfur-dependent, subunit alpha [Xanthobacteraceae bacterium Astr-EGSB]|uniref:L-cysteine desulfidase family protein n=1 Tax=Astrobacterium formosum TaxID=3069710 RepID=UPI0027B843A1|nr:L-serine ammonia-lyase, iron-sulfur-dependent, subunit alpha [Xanthobacteraceae bacterium Astr-EGSB]
MSTTADIHRTYLAILRRELVPALGCTEPIAVAYAAAEAARVLGTSPDHAEIWCSGNIIKNVMGVVVPNTGGLKGVDAAAIAGIIGGDSGLGMQVLETVTAARHAEIRRLLDARFCSTHLIEGEDNLFIIAKVFAGDQTAEVVIRGAHTNIVRVVRSGEVIVDDAGEDDVGESVDAPSPELNVRDILAFADTVALDQIADIISAQIEKNTRIAEEGLRGQYGVCVGRTLLKHCGSDFKTRAKARAAAGSDARMSGCALPVIINSGSGNQGIAVSLPVITYAEDMKVGREELYRALVLSNLIAIHQKTAIGKLSAFCGAVSAACGSGAAITYLSGGDYEEICNTITNTLANVGGIVCDGAKPSCAAKIASAVDAAIMAHHLSVEGKVFSGGEGLVTADVECTIANIGRMASEGMKSTDVEILRLMVGGAR